VTVATSAAPTPVLELVGISKAFGSTVALSDASLTVDAGSVHAVLGENGAGKTTLMRVAFGLVRPDQGRIRIHGRAAGGYSARAARAAGIGMVHQHLSLVPALTAAENLALGGRGLFRHRDAEQLLVRTAEASGLHVPADARVEELGIVQQQRLELLKALARGARILILDEPTSGLAPPEIEDLLRWIRQFAGAGGSVVLVTHKLREALAVADRVTVLRRGSVVHSAGGEGATAEALTRAIFPEAGAREAGSPGSPPGAVVASAQGISIASPRGSAIRQASFELRRHEIVGVAAVEGSGHRELLAAMAGLLPVSAGALRLPRRIALIPADRGRDAVIRDFSLVENVALRGAGTRTGRMPWSELGVRTEALLRQFQVVARSPGARMAELSGGNQQRVVVARELDGDADLVVADDPTRGLDLRASEFVHQQLRAAAARGAAVLLHSSDIDDLLALATRVLVAFHGEVREVEAVRDSVGRAMLGTLG
jgi:general nucleoside transport system ATP-binding protein